MSTLSIRMAGLLIVISMLLFPAGALAVPPETGETVHVVQWGETLSLIASRYGVTVEAIMAANSLSDPNLIYVGQRLIIPTPGAPGGPAQGGRHVVAPGETLTSIAFRYGTTVGALVAANGLSNSDLIYVGQVLNVPGGQPSGPVSGGCTSYYTVQAGDTLSGIAWHYGTTVNALMQANGLYNDFIYQGQRLCVPPGGAALPAPGPATYYTVRPGDTLSAIAMRFGVSQAAIVRANNLADPWFIYVGQRLVIPGLSKPAAVYQIAFSRWDGGKHNLYIANTDGSGERFLLERAAGPSWSPNGQYLSFYGAEGVDRQPGRPTAFEGITNGVIIVPVANWPGSLELLQLFQVQREGTARATAWSPDGNVIAWDAKPGGGYRIYFQAAKGTAFDPKLAELQSVIEIPGEHPAWSPDGRQLVYRSGRDNRQGIWISNRDGSGSVNITNEGSDAFPRWSPDGRRIAFHRDSGGNVDIYVVNTDGSNVRRLTDAPGPDALPAWTPDGRIVFRSARTGSWGIYIMNANGSGQKQIIANADPGPDWTFGRLDVHSN